MTEAPAAWLNPPEDLLALAELVEVASHVAVDAGSAADEARDHLCRIAALRLSRQWIANERLVVMLEAADSKRYAPK